MKFPGDIWFGLQLKTTCPRVKNGKLSKDMHYNVTKAEITSIYGDVVILGAAIKSFTINQIRCIKTHGYNGVMNVTVEILELFILDGIALSTNISYLIKSS